MLSDTAHENFNLFTREHPASTLAESRHGSPTNSFFDCGMKNKIVGNRQVGRIVNCQCRATFSILSVASGTIPSVKNLKVCNSIRNLRCLYRPLGKRGSITARNSNESYQQRQSFPNKKSHSLSPLAR